MGKGNIRRAVLLKRRAEGSDLKQPFCEAKGRGDNQKRMTYLHQLTPTPTVQKTTGNNGKELWGA